MALRIESAEAIIETGSLQPGHLNVASAAVIYEIPAFGLGSAPPVTFNLQKLVLTVKESNIPARGRNQ